MVEHPHHQRGTIADLTGYMADLSVKLREKDEKDLDAYRFLQEAGEDIPGQLDAAFSRTKRLLAVCAAVCLAFFLLISFFGRGSADLSDLLTRPEPDEEEKQAGVLLQLSYDGKTLERETQLQIPPRAWTRREADALFDRCERELRQGFEKNGTDLNALHADLHLPKSSADGQVAIVWNSSDPARITEDGRVNLTGAREGEPMTLTAVLSVQDYVRQIEFDVKLSPAAVEDWDGSLAMEAEALLRELPASLSDTRQILPAESPSGAGARWSVLRSGLPWEIFGLFLLLGAAIVFSRNDAVKRNLKRKKEAFELEIPNMTMQMILLLDAGLTVESAFSRMVRENEGKDIPLYRAFSRLEAESRATNMPFVNLLYVYARQSGMRDLIRFASLALDCSGRGSELAEKLDRERRQLWSGRLDLAKAKAREAETKLSFPLMVLLLVMVVIAISPALMEL